MHRAILISLLAATLGLTGCQSQPTTHQARGIITDLQVRDIARAEWIRLRTDDGRDLTLTMGESVTFSASHLREHMVFAEPVTVTYVAGPDGAVATTIEDATP